MRRAKFLGGAGERLSKHKHKESKRDVLLRETRTCLAFVRMYVCVCCVCVLCVYVFLPLRVCAFAEASKCSGGEKGQ